MGRPMLRQRPSPTCSNPRLTRHRPSPTCNTPTPTRQRPFLHAIPPRLRVSGPFLHAIPPYPHASAPFRGAITLPRHVSGPLLHRKSNALPIAAQPFTGKMQPPHFFPRSPAGRRAKKPQTTLFHPTMRTLPSPPSPAKRGRATPRAVTELLAGLNPSGSKEIGVKPPL